MERIVVYLETCTCGNDIASHFKDEKGHVGACLCANCPCKAFSIDPSLMTMPKEEVQ